MGSIIQSTPLLQSIRLNYPKSEIIFVSSVQNEDLLSLYKEYQVIDDYILLNDSKFSKLIFNILPFIFNLISRRVSLLFPPFPKTDLGFIYGPHNTEWGYILI